MLNDDVEFLSMMIANQNQAIQSSMMYSGLMTDICRPLFEKLAIKFFSFTTFNEKGDFIYLTTDPRVINQASEQNFLHEFTNTVFTGYKKRGYYLLDADSNARQSESLWINLHREFNRGHCLANIDSHPKQKEAAVNQYFFVGDSSNDSINTTYLNNLQLIDEFKKYFHERFDKLIEDQPRIIVADKLCLSEDCFCDLLEQSQHIDTMQSQCNQSSNEIHQFFFDNNLEIKLTSRQKEIIDWYMNGKTAEETANIMQISRRTVERHFETLRQKFNCKTKDQILMKILTADRAVA